jgi:HlyD family secretion protein
VKIGDKVSAGDLLITIDNSSLIKSLEQAKYQLMIDQDALNDMKQSGNITLQANYEQVLSFYNRTKESYENNQALYESGIISLTELNSFKSSLDSAYSSYVNVKNQLNTSSIGNELDKLTAKISIDLLEIEQIERQIEATNILSPIDGIVTFVTENIGASIQTGSIATSITDLNQLEVTTGISEYDIHLIKIGQDVMISTLGNTDHFYKGLITSIAPIGTSTGTEVLIDVTIKILSPDELLKPNFTATLDILIGQKENALAVPYDALIDSPKGGSLVLKVVDGIETPVRVQTGMETDMMIEVLSDNLSAGDEIVIPSSAKPSAELEKNLFRVPGAGGGNKPK